MAVYRGAPVFGTDEANGLQAAGRSALVVSEDVSYVGRSLAIYGMSWWHLGVVCLIGNCISMSVYLAVQVRPDPGRSDQPCFHPMSKSLSCAPRWPCLLQCAAKEDQTVYITAFAF